MLNNIKYLLKNRVVKNTSWILFEKVFQMIISLVVGMITARYLGPTNYGLINYVAAFIAFATPICNLGMDAVLIKKIVDNSDEQEKYIGTAILMEFVVSLLCASIIVLIIYLSDIANIIKALVAALESILLVAKCAEPIDYYFQSKLKSRYTSIIKIIGYVIMSIYKLYLVFTNKSVLWFAFSTSLDMIVIAFLYFIFYRYKEKKVLLFDVKIAKNIIHESYHFIISGLIVVLYTQMDKIMIGNLLNTTEVGLYSAATKVCTYWGFIPTAIISSFRPVIFEAKKTNNNYIGKLKLLYAIIFWLSIIISIIITCFSKFIILVLYGEDYIMARTTLIIAIWYTAFAYLGSARGIWIVSENKNKYSKKYILIGAILNLLLNFIFIPKYGINGAAIATLITQITVALITPLFYRETRISTKYMIDSMLLRGVRFYDFRENEEK